jgi:Methyltransferase FkbM domain
VAVGDRCTPLRFSVDASDSLVGHLTSERDASSGTIEVECVTLDSLGPQLSPARLIVMDVEGAEAMVLRGAREYISMHHPAIVLEADQHLLERAGSTPADVCHELTSCSYDLYRISSLNLLPINPAALDPTDAAKWTNWLCLHSSKKGLARAARRYLKTCGLLPCVARLNPLTGK